MAIHSHAVWEALDAHGHAVAAEALQCPTCVTAYGADGYCDKHRRGFVAGKAYYSRLTYYLARGRTAEAVVGDCPICGSSERIPGWCEVHAIGRVGNVVFKDRSDYEHAAAAMRVLFEALERVDSCELCAAAMAIDGRCPVHKLTFDRGVEHSP